MWNEFTNALAWFEAAPAEWIRSGKQNLEAAAEWIWNVLQGDFADEQSTAQTITGTVISMIPFVDQICDVRDLVANCRKINQDTGNKFAWLALALTLIGLFPCLGSLAKGCLKIPLNYARKFALRAGTKAFDSSLWKLTAPYIENGVVKLNQHLNHPAVRKTLAALKIDNVWKYLANKVREARGMLSTSKLMGLFDDLFDALKSFCEMIQKWGNAAMQTKAAELLKSVKAVRDRGNKQLAEIIKPLQDWLDNLAVRLDKEAEQNYKALTNAKNSHRWTKPSLDAEVQAMEKEKPTWVDSLKEPPFEALDAPPPIPPGYPNVAANTGPLANKFNTFHQMSAVEIPPGTKLYRVLDPLSSDNSICWMRESEFLKLKSKDDWRRRFAVWANWNSNGEYVTYIVPPGKPLLVWEGITGSQILKREVAGVDEAVKAGNKGEKFILEGGGIQIVLDPATLDRAHIGQRQSTKWGYGSFGESPSMLGIPVLTQNWYERKK
ncbi:hypothetical protein [Niveibacterium sp. SC-1]|uniref:hypothetical protein n=1 Tax=Niveibacterium sp. SC-1 TaxID=3135646 RepID=UPI00311F5871